MDEQSTLPTITSIHAALAALCPDDDMVLVDAAGDHSFIGRCVRLDEGNGSRYEPVAMVSPDAVRKLKHELWVESAMNPHKAPGTGVVGCSPVVRISDAGRAHIAQLIDDDNTCASLAIINADPAKMAMGYRFVEKRFKERDGAQVPVYVFQPPALVVDPGVGAVCTIDG